MGCPWGRCWLQDQASHRAHFARVGGSKRTDLLGSQHRAPFTAISPKRLSLAEKDPQGPSLLHKELVISSWASKDARLVEALLGGQGPLRCGTERVGVICSYLSSLELSACDFAYLVFFTSQ